MITNTVAKSKSSSGVKTLVSKLRSIAGRKIWLPKLIYDSLPYFYLAAGFAAFFATLYISEWFWVVPHYLLFSGACLHLAVKVSRMRRKRGADFADRAPDSDSPSIR